jgi:glycosyltransferase involved in cell wall biosynthesis
MSKALLTVAIPTYNRPETLERILVTLKANDSSTFEILVSDDSSTNGVEHLIKKYQQEMPNLIYHKNPNNLGFNGNVCNLYKLSRTRYVWFLCDDDSVYPNAVPEIVECLQRHEPVVALFNCSWEDAYGINRTTPFKERVYSREEDIDDYRTVMRLTFLSIIVVEKRLPLDSIINHPNFNDNVFVQLSIAFLLLSGKFKFCEFEPSILHRNVGYKYGEFFKFYTLDPWKAFYLIPHKFSEKRMKEYMISNLPSAMQLYLSQKLGLFVFKIKPTKATFIYLREYYGLAWSSFIRFIRFVCDITPAFLFKGIYFIQLVRLHGFSGGVKVYKRLINRAYFDQRDTGFTSYQ